MIRRAAWLRRIAWCAAMPLLVGLLAACAGMPERPPEWQARLAGDALVLLGEVHDNAALHRRRLDILRAAFARGWRPAIVMEQFDRNRQADIERARRERPHDAQHVIDVAAPSPSGWDWALYRPIVALALAHDVPLVAGNVSGADASRIVRGGDAAVFDAAEIAALGLGRTIEPTWQAAQEREIDAGHCHQLPATLWPRMARAQFARDAAMAEAVRRHGARGAVLIAGNGHVRRDLGVPRWLEGDTARLFTVGFLERDDALPADAFDAVVVGAAVERGDPCARVAPPSRGASAP